MPDQKMKKELKRTGDDELKTGIELVFLVLKQ
jgi:hypothetical protein